jgi:hypothetical protein
LDSKLFFQEPGRVGRDNVADARSSTGSIALVDKRA